jgi:putative ABC transport system permease protein
MIDVGFRYALRERARFLLTAGGLACAVVLTVFLAGVYRGAVHGSVSYIENADATVWVGRRGSWNLLRASGLLPDSVREQVLAVEGVSSVEPILSALLPAEFDGQRRTLLVVGLDPDATAGVPRHLEEGVGNPRAGEITVDRAFARRAGIASGDELQLAGRRLRVAGVSRETNLLVTQYAFVARAELLDLLGLEDRASFLLVKTDPRRAAAIAHRIEAAVPEISAFDRETFLANNLQEIEAGYLPVLWAIAMLGLAVGGSVVALMTYAAVLEKRGDYVLLAAIGADRSTQFAVVMQQAIAAAVAGGIGGLALLFALGPLLPALVPEVEFRLEPWIAAAALAGAVGMAALGALFPARVATRLPPMEAFGR